MEPESSLPHLQAPTNCPYPEPDLSSPSAPSHFSTINFNIILPSMPKSFKWPLYITSLHQNPVWTSPAPPPRILATCPAQITLLDSWWRHGDRQVLGLGGILKLHLQQRFHRFISRRREQIDCWKWYPDVSLRLAQCFISCLDHHQEMWCGCLKTNTL